MGPKQWFLIKWENGYPVIASKMYDSREEAIERYNHQDDPFFYSVCETIYGH